GDQRLVGYLVGESGGEEELRERERELRVQLRGRLPEYMVPSAYVWLAELPLTPNGKVDRRGLPAPEQVQSAAAEYVGPRNELEERLAGIWRELLRVERVGVTDNFFELGGHSLLATQVVSRVRQALQQEVALRTLFEAPTIALLAEWIEASRQDGPGAAAVLILPVSRSEPLPLSFAQQRLWFLDQLEPDSAVNNVFLAMRMEGKLYVEALERSFNEVVARHEVLRTTFRSEAGRPVQVIARAQHLPLAIINL